MEPVRVLSPEEFDGLLAGGGVILADFFADWCMPCKMMAPVVEKIAADFAGKLTVVSINVDEIPDLAVRYQIQSIPALLIFQGGEVKDTLIGARPYDDLAAAIEKQTGASA